MTHSTASKALIGLMVATAFGIVAIISSTLTNTKGQVIENKMVEVELLRIVDHSPVYVDIRDISTGIEYNSVYVADDFEDFDQLPYNFPFLVTRLKRLNDKDGTIRIEWRDLDSGLNWSKRFKMNVKN